MFVQYLFDFDASYRDQNFIFVFDHSTRTFLTSDIFIKLATIVSNEYLRYGKNFDINSFFTDWFVSKKKGNGEVIGNYEDYQKLPTNKKYFMLLIQTNNRHYIRQGAIFFTCLKEFKGVDTIIRKSQHFRTITIPPHHLAQLRRKFKNFCLTSFDEWKCIKIQQQPGMKTISNTTGFMCGQNFGLVNFENLVNHCIQNG